MQLGDQRSLPIDQVFDHDELPQGPITVEALHDHGLDESNDVVECVAPARRYEAHVIREVEILVELPPGRRDRIRIPDHALAQPRDVAGGAVDAVHDARAFGCPVEQGDRGDRAAQQRVLLDHPHDAIEVGHPIVVAHQNNLSSSDSMPRNSL